MIKCLKSTIRRRKNEMEDISKVELAGLNKPKIDMLKETREAKEKAFETLKNLLLDKFAGRIDEFKKDFLEERINYDQLILKMTGVFPPRSLQNFAREARRELREIWDGVRRSRGWRSYEKAAKELGTNAKTLQRIAFLDTLAQGNVAVETLRLVFSRLIGSEHPLADRVRVVIDQLESEEC
jgi:hypothetical protein